MKPPAPPAPLPWVTIACALTVVALAGAFKFGGSRLVEEARLSPELLNDRAHWWRLVAALFVHGNDQVFTALMGLGLIVNWGFRAERAFGRGGMLTTFLVGGAAANLLRCALESPGWLEVAGTGAITGGAALAGAAVSGAVRTREGSLAGTLVSALVSTCFAVFFSTPELGVALGETTVRYLASAGGAFVLGGFLGSALPLRTAEGARVARALLFAISLAIAAACGTLFARALRPPEPTAEPGKKRPRSVPSRDEDDAELGLSYEVPLAFAKYDEDSKGGPVSAYKPTFRLYFPRLILRVIPRGEYYAADTTALQLAGREREQDPTAKLVSEGAIECPLGPAYHVALVISQESLEYVSWDCFVTPRETDKTVWIRLMTEPDDESARGVLESVVRSLKLRPGRADKEDGSRKGGRPR